MVVDYKGRYGEYIVQKLGDREELLGADVIVPHRMLENHVIERTGVKAYALFSEAAAIALNLSELSQPLIPLENSTRLRVTMGTPEPEPDEAVRGQFQWMTGLFGNMQSVIEQELAEGKISLT